MIICQGAFPPSSKRTWITWSILDACNYSCSYCPIKANEIASDEKIEEGIRFIKAVKGRKLDITLFGGEPTIHPRLPFIVDSLLEAGIVSVFTNLSASAEYYIEHLKNTRLSISYHPDMVSAEKFISKLEVLFDFWPPMIGFVNVMMVEGYENQWKAVAEFCRKKGIIHKISPICKLEMSSELFEATIYSRRPDVLQFNETMVINDSLKRELLTASQVEAFNLNAFGGYKCFAGLCSFFIDHRGDVFKCQADMYKGVKTCTTADPVGYAMDVVKSCPHERCICEYYVPKECVEGAANSYLMDLSND